MQQRLGLARVLLHDPQVLLLDEPASGLDPGARIEVRELIKELGRMGKTILVSSHILHELGDLCNKIGVIEQGKLLYAGSVDDVLQHVQTEVVVHIELVEEDLEPARALDPERMSGVERADINGKRLDVVLSAEMAEPWEIAKLVLAENLRLTRFQREQVNLEDVFLRLTRGLVQ